MIFIDAIDAKSITGEISIHFSAFQNHYSNPLTGNHEQLKKEPTIDHCPMHNDIIISLNEVYHTQREIAEFVGTHISA